MSWARLLKRVLAAIFSLSSVLSLLIRNGADPSAQAALALALRLA
jgi:hypothetical protein